MVVAQTVAVAATALPGLHPMVSIQPETSKIESGERNTEGELLLARQEDVELIFRIMRKCRPMAMEHVSISRRGEVAVMRQLTDGAQLTPSKLAENTGNTPGRISAILSALERKGWIVRIIDPSNRRRVLVSLTDSGTEAIEEHRKMIDACTAWVFDHMGDEDTERFLQLLAEFMSYLSLLRPCKPFPEEKDVAALFAQRYQEFITEGSAEPSAASSATATSSTPATSSASQATSESGKSSTSTATATSAAEPVVESDDQKGNES